MATFFTTQDPNSSFILEPNGLPFVWKDGYLRTKDKKAVEYLKKRPFTEMLKDSK